MASNPPGDLPVITGDQAEAMTFRSDRGRFSDPAGAAGNGGRHGPWVVR